MALKIVSANILRSSGDFHARVMAQRGFLRQYLIGARRFTNGIDPSLQKRYPLFGLIDYVAGRTLSVYQGESVRFAAVPIFERWAKKQLLPGDSLFTGFGYLNGCLEWVKERGGLALLQARNSHPSNFWSLMAEEYARWDCSLPPIHTVHHMRQQRSAAIADYIFSPSHFVTESFVSRGFPPDRILYLPYSVELSLFKPRTTPRPAHQPLTLASSGLLSLRKGTPYLMDAFRLIREAEPGARLRLIRTMADSFDPIYREKYSDLPVEWSDPMPHSRLAEWLQEADVFVLPSLEDGFARVVIEAMACGLPAVLTPNTGAVDLIQQDVSGSVVPIRDPKATAEAVLHWWRKIKDGGRSAQDFDTLRSRWSFDRFAANLEGILKALNAA